MLIFMLWILLAVCAAALSRARGHSFAITLLLSLILSPIVGLIIELCRAKAEQHPAGTAHVQMAEVAASSTAQAAENAIYERAALAEAEPLTVAKRQPAEYY